MPLYQISFLEQQNRGQETTAKALGMDRYRYRTRGRAVLYRSSKLILRLILLVLLLKLELIF